MIIILAFLPGKVYKSYLNSMYSPCIGSGPTIFIHQHCLFLLLYKCGINSFLIILFLLLYKCGINSFLIILFLLLYKCGINSFLIILALYVKMKCYFQIFSQQPIQANNKEQHKIVKTALFSIARNNRYRRRITVLNMNNDLVTCKTNH